MSKARHSRKWYDGERYHLTKWDRNRAKIAKKVRKFRRERERRDKRVTECYPEHGHSSCGRKSRFESRDAALRYIERYWSEALLSVYKCPYCGGWHLTSHPWNAEDGGDLTVREVLEAARESAVQIRRIEQELEIKRQAIGPQGYSIGVHTKGSILDPMRKVDEMIDAQDEAIEIAQLRDSLDEAWDVVRGMAKIVDDLTVELVTRYFLQADSWASIAADLESRHIEPLEGLNRGEQVDILSKTMDAAIARIERVGIAHLKEMGRG